MIEEHDEKKKYAKEERHNVLFPLPTEEHFRVDSSPEGGRVLSRNSALGGGNLSRWKRDTDIGEVQQLTMVHAHRRDYYLTRVVRGVEEPLCRFFFPKRHVAFVSFLCSCTSKYSSSCLPLYSENAEELKWNSILLRLLSGWSQ